MTEEIPQWAKERACALANARQGGRRLWDTSDIPRMDILTAFARYIAQHEQPPVDPDLVKAREICARSSLSIDRGERYRSGEFDNFNEVLFALTALKEARNA